jgi:hypothetical protein
MKKVCGALFFLLIPFLFSGCFTMMYHDEVVERGAHEYIEKPFSDDNRWGHYIGIQDYNGVFYDVFVFKNLIETAEDRYVKICLPHKDEEWHEDKEYSERFIVPVSVLSSYQWSRRGPQLYDYEVDASKMKTVEGLVIMEAGAEDFSDEKSLADCMVTVSYWQKGKVLFLSCDYNSPMKNKYSFAFFIPSKSVMDFYGKGKPFPSYIFSYLGYPGPIAADVVTSPFQIFIMWFVFRDFNLGG